MRLQRWIRRLWAAPCSIVGLFVALTVWLAGGRARSLDGTLEVTLRPTVAACGPRLRRLPYRAITLGHVIIAATEQELDRMRAHERVHVQQYERWGLLFFVAYAASSAWQLLRGRSAYWDNHFEIEARRRSASGSSRHEP